MQSETIPQTSELGIFIVSVERKDRTIYSQMLSGSRKVSPKKIAERRLPTAVTACMPNRLTSRERNGAISRDGTILMIVVTPISVNAFRLFLK